MFRCHVCFRFLHFRFRSHVFFIQCVSLQMMISGCRHRCSDADGFSKFYFHVWMRAFRIHVSNPSVCFQTWNSLFDRVFHISHVISGVMDCSFKSPSFESGFLFRVGYFKSCNSSFGFDVLVFWFWRSGFKCDELYLKFRGLKFRAWVVVFNYISLVMAYLHCRFLTCQGPRL